MNIVAEFQEFVRLAIQLALPRIVAGLLSDSDWNVRIASAYSLSMLSENGRIYLVLVSALLMSIVAEFRESIMIRQAISQVVALLNDSNWNVREAGANALLKLSKQGRIYDFLV